MKYYFTSCLPEECCSVAETRALILILQSSRWWRSEHAALLPRQKAGKSISHQHNFQHLESSSMTSKDISNLPMSLISLCRSFDPLLYRQSFIPRAPHGTASIK